jgi:hypothetical protein
MDFTRIKQMVCCLTPQIIDICGGGDHPFAFEAARLGTRAMAFTVTDVSEDLILALGSGYGR